MQDENLEFASNADQKTTYDKLIKMLDIGEAMLDELEYSDLKNRDELAEICLPVIASIEEAIAQIEVTFVEHIKAGEEPDRERSIAVNNAFKKMYSALQEMNSKGKAMFKRIKQEGNYA